MHNVLIAGLPTDLEQWLIQRLGNIAGLTLQTAHTGEQALGLLAQGRHRLLVVDDRLQGMAVGEILASARRELGLDNMRAIVCLERKRLGQVADGLSASLLADDKMLFYPLDREKLIQDILAGCPPGEAGGKEDEPDSDDSLDSVAVDLWPQFKERIFDQVATLEQEVLALLDGKTDPESLKTAQREAHKLAGSLGSLGFEHGTRLAREIEHTFQAKLVPGQAECLRLCDCVVQLRSELEKGPIRKPRPVEHDSSPEPASREEHRPLLLIIDADRELASSVSLEASRSGLRAEVITNPKSARDLFSGSSPSAILLDPCFPEGVETGLQFLSELTASKPSIPVLVFTSKDLLKDRLRVAQLGAQVSLEKPMPVPRVIEAVTHLLDRRKSSRTRVLAVDDDPAVLDTLSRWLEPQGILLHTLSDPLRFWDTVEGFAPDLLLLDSDMPHLSGLELCRALRKDVRWSGLPVLFLTSDGDMKTLQEVFAAGGDDFVVKPFVGPELLARVSTRIERSCQLISMVERDRLTGTDSLKTSVWYLDKLFRLANRRKEPLCLAVLEPDDFDQVSTHYGRSSGDLVYRRLGELLVSSFRTEDVISRWEGDEFVLGLSGMALGDGVQRLAELLETFRQEEFTSDSGIKFGMTLSAGIAVYPRDGCDVHSLYRAARHALGQAKKMGGDRILTSGRWVSDPNSKLTPDIVVVDDDEALAGLLSHALTTRGYVARHFKDGLSALKALGGPLPELRPQVLLLDVDLPNLDGLSVLRRLAADGVVKRTRVIMLTARSSEAEVITALEWGAFDHVAKPFSLRVLMQRVRRALEA
jgi:diguanylate cyclase (GGDEF)-like protein